MIENIGNPSGISPALYDALNEVAPARGDAQAVRVLSSDGAVALDGAGAAKARQLEKLGLPAPAAGSGGGLSGALQSLEDSAQADIFAMMALFQKFAQEQRNAARETRVASLQGQEAALRGAADKIREAAEERFKGALAAGICQIASGAVTLGATGMAMKTLPGNAQAPGADIAVEKSKGWSAGGQGVSGMVDGAGKIVQAVYERKSGEADAARANLEADAKIMETGAQEAADIMQQMMSVIQDIRDKLGALEQSRAETNRGIARNI